MQINEALELKQDMLDVVRDVATDPDLNREQRLQILVAIAQTAGREAERMMVEMLTANETVPENVTNIFDRRKH